MGKVGKTSSALANLIMKIFLPKPKKAINAILRAHQKSQPYALPKNWRVEALNTV